MKKKGIDFDANRLLIIERVCSRGLEKDWREMIRHYGWETVKREVVRIGWLDDSMTVYNRITTEEDSHELSA
jgi:hypothetical protein